jgi:signal transduction histidine kinase
LSKLRFYMIVFAVLVSLPVAFVAWRTDAALDREARAQMRFFAEQLLDAIEAELSDMVRREENRAVDEYQPVLMHGGAASPSPLAKPPEDGFILGYFQNNPDGSFQTPLAADSAQAPVAAAERVRRLQSVNARFNQRKHGAPPPAPATVEAPKREATPPEAQTAFADRFIRPSPRQKTKSALGQAEPRLEEISKEQARNLARLKPDAESLSSAPRAEGGLGQDASRRSASSGSPAPAEVPRQPVLQAEEERFQAEVAPLQAVVIDREQVFIFRRIGINGRIYRQGFVVLLKPFLDYLFTAHYVSQPISRYTRLTLRAAGVALTRNGTNGNEAGGMMAAERVFPAPFGFLSAGMQAVSLPPSPARQTLTVALAILGIVVAAGLATIYRSARTVLDLSERRSRFVSAVTHELKTPLTNIRMYVEMLEQGIAPTPAREREYLGVLASESARLSGLINNVLELSRLEKRTRRFDFRPGDLSDVLADVKAIMAELLAREGFTLTIRADGVPLFAYDREVLVQILINLMENSIKFGRQASEKRITITAAATGDRVDLSVSDTGPGIPGRAVKHVFDDFYRVDDEKVRGPGGTGIGLALVKKFVLAMGGQVWVKNNDGPGCTIGLGLPKQPETAGGRATT